MAALLDILIRTLCTESGISKGKSCTTCDLKKLNFQNQQTSTNLQQTCTILALNLHLHHPNQRLSQKTGPLLNYLTKSWFNHLRRYKSSKPTENFSLTTILHLLLTPYDEWMLIYGGIHFVTKSKQ